MPLISTYSVKIKDYNRIFRHTVKEYRRAVDFLIHVADENWDLFTGLARNNDCIGIMENSSMQKNQIQRQSMGLTWNSQNFQVTFFVPQ